MNNEEIREKVRKGYAEVAKGQGTCCGLSAGCGVETISKKIGYSDEEVRSAPNGANMGLGCGNPVALASLKEGETVLDLGSGGGFDCFLASARVGDKGRVIGVDMTAEMISKARRNAEDNGYKNVEFRLGEIENLPVADGSVDVVISNCVINLSTDKERVFEEIYRVLKKGGRLKVSDIVFEKELPEEIRTDIEAYFGCIAGAILKQDYFQFIRNAGLQDVKEEAIIEVPLMDYQDINSVLEGSTAGRSLLKKLNDNIDELTGSVKSIKVSAFKK